MSRHTLENTLSIWNQYVPNFQIQMSDFQNQKTSFFIEAYLAFFETIGIDSDVVLRGPLSENQMDEHAEYYADLMPAINMIKAIKSTVLKLNKDHCVIFLEGILFPASKTTFHVLQMLTNYAIFAKERIEESSVHIDVVFKLEKDIEALMNERDRLLRQENELSAEKANRAERMKQYEEEHNICSKQLQETLNAKKELIQEYEILSKQHEEKMKFIEQKKVFKESIQKENTKIQSEIVGDADDIRDQHVTAMQTEEKAKEKMENLKQVYNDKNNLLNNFAILKKKLKPGTDLLDDVITLAAQLRDVSMVDLNSDSDQIELMNIQNELDNVTTALDNIQNNKSEEEEYRNEIEELRSQLQAAQFAENAAEDLFAKIEAQKKCDEIIELQKSTLKFENERKSILDDVNNYEAGIIKQIHEYEDTLKALIDSTKEEISKRFK